MAKSVNQVTILGNLTRDPDMRSTPNGHSVITFTVALNRSYKDNSGEWKETADYVDCVAWSALADKVHEKCFKGSRVLVQGRLQSRSWEKDGQKRSKVEVLASDVIFIDKQQGNTIQQKQQASPMDSSSYDDPIDLSDIPF